MSRRRRRSARRNSRRNRSRRRTRSRSKSRSKRRGKIKPGDWQACPKRHKLKSHAGLDWIKRNSFQIKFLYCKTTFTYKLSGEKT